MSGPIKNATAAVAFVVFLGLGGGAALADGDTVQTGGASGCCRMAME